MTSFLVEMDYDNCSGSVGNYNHFRCSGSALLTLGVQSIETKHLRRESRLAFTLLECSEFRDHSPTARSLPMISTVLWGPEWILLTSVRSGDHGRRRRRSVIWEWERWTSADWWIWLSDDSVSIFLTNLIFASCVSIKFPLKLFNIF